MQGTSQKLMSWTTYRARSAYMVGNGAPRTCGCASRARASTSARKL